MGFEDPYYELWFENAFLRAKGNSFQELFERLMSLAYKDDFMACRPWGNRGDRKNDGFLKSERRLFQVYAPNEMTENKAIAKIQEDFNGAKEHWNEHFDKWVFVHNAVDGLPPHIHDLILDLEKENPGVTLEPWGLEKLKDIFRRLTPDDMKSWFGAVPTHETRANLGFKDLQVVLETLASRVAPVDGPVRVVPHGKIEANALSESAASILKQGMAKATLVEDFFKQWRDASFGERIATSFRAKYDSLRVDRTPMDVFLELQTWAGGANLGTPEHQLAVFTVLAYYFERCDIFEEPGISQS